MTYTRGDALREMAAEAGESLGPTNGQGPADGGFAETDAGNGELFASLFADQVRYDHQTGTWLIWNDGLWWEPDDAGKVFQFVKDAARRRWIEAADGTRQERRITGRHVYRSESRQGIEATLKLAQSEPQIRIGERSASEWDSDPYLLGVGNGVVDLRTGILRPGKPSDRITMHTPIPFDPNATCGRFDLFLLQVFDYDEELVAFIQRSAGYTLTGDTKEQSFFLNHGAGCNGKSVFLTAMREVMGQYGANTPFTTFEEHKRAPIPSDLARLKGRRLVTAVETGQASRLAEDRLKMLTGESIVTARFMHHDWFDFRPVTKIWLAVHDRPIVRDRSYGFWRRPLEIPWNVRFEDDRDDLDLEEKLRAEYPGILAWMVRGALAWQAEGLNPPDSVRQATQAFQESTDPISEYLGDRTYEGLEYQCSKGLLYADYVEWCENGKFSRGDIASKRAFGIYIGHRDGIDEGRLNRDRFWIGIGLKHEY